MDHHSKNKEIVTETKDKIIKFKRQNKRNE